MSCLECSPTWSAGKANAKKEALAVVWACREGANLPYQAIILTIVTIGQSSSQPDLWKRKFPSASKYRKAGTQTHAVGLLDSSQARQHEHEHSRLLLEKDLGPRGDRKRKVHQLRR
jgi:hypothetical protein